MRNQRRAHVLLTALVMLPLFFVLLSMLFGRSLTRMFSSQRERRHQTASYTADAALAQAVALLRRDPKFHDAVEVKYPDLDASAAIHFDSSRADASVNNANGDGPVDLPGTSQQVYASQVHLVAVAQCRGQQLKKQLRLAAPPFPFVIYSSGSFHSGGGLLLGSVKAGTDIHQALTADKLLPAEMLANSTGADALVLEGESTLVGSPKTPGQAHKGDHVQILQGDIQSGARAQDAPNINLHDYDPANSPGLQTLTESTYTDRTPMSGLVRYTGPQLTFNQGLDLEGGVLYVEGNVTIPAGGIRGSGALICTGNVTLTGASDLATDSKVAILAGGDAQLTGTGKTGSFYQGLLYAAGPNGISASGVTLMGAAVAANPNGAKVDIHDANLLFQQSATNFSADLGFSGYPEGGFHVESDRLSGQPEGWLRLKPDSKTGKTPTLATFAARGQATLTATDFVFYGADGKEDSSHLDAAFRLKTSVPEFQEFLKEPGKVKNEGPVSNGTFKLDLNKFVNTADKLRMIWRS